jgi:hypothetical protein
VLGQTIKSELEAVVGRERFHDTKPFKDQMPESIDPAQKDRCSGCHTSNTCPRLILMLAAAVGELFSMNTPTYPNA